MIEFERILCAVDFSEHSKRTVDHALALAGWYQARLTLLHVHLNRAVMDVPPLVLTPPERDRLVNGMRELAGSPPAGVSIDYQVSEAADVRQEILGRIADTRADLFVIGSHGHSGFRRFLLGSVTEHVVREARCPVMVVSPRAPDADPSAPVRFARMLCPVDFSDGSLKALDVALALAQEASAHLLVLHAIEYPPEFGDDASATGPDLLRTHKSWPPRPRIAAT